MRHPTGSVFAISLICLCAAACGSISVATDDNRADDTSVSQVPEASTADSFTVEPPADTTVGTDDAGPNDAGPNDAGPNDAGPNDAGPNDAGPNDAGPNDAGPNDAGPNDAGPQITDQACPEALNSGCAVVEIPEGPVGAPCGPTGAYSCQVVTVPKFGIDAYEMTVPRYDLLMTGSTSDAGSLLPKNLSKSNLGTACQAAGGRLCSYLEWYRAAFGPADSNAQGVCDGPTYIWGEATPTPQHATYDADGPRSVLNTPEGASDLGVYNLSSNLTEVVSDLHEDKSGYPACGRLPSYGSTLAPQSGISANIALGCYYACTAVPLAKLRDGFVDSSHGVGSGAPSAGGRCCYDLVP